MTQTDLEVLTQDEAQGLTDRIKETLSVAWELLLEAWQRGAWKALGYETWDAYCVAEFENSRMVRLPRDQRQEIVVEMRQEGMSTRAIGSALGVDPMTVSRDLSTVESATVGSITGTNGKIYKPKTAPVEEPEIVDAEIVDDTAWPFCGPQERVIPVVLKRVAQELSPVFALKNPKAEDIQDIEAYLEKVQKQLALLKKRVKINAS